MVKKKYLIDTSIIIDSIRQNFSNADRQLFELYGDDLYTSPIIIAELFSGKSTQNKKVFVYLEYLISPFKIVPIDTETAILTGQLRSKYALDIADAFIAASAITNSLILVTHDSKHFDKIIGLKTTTIPKQN